MSFHTTFGSLSPSCAPSCATTGAAVAFGEKQGDNLAAIERFRVATKRMPGL